MRRLAVYASKLGAIVILLGLTSAACADVHVKAYTALYGMTGVAIQAAIDAAFAAKDDRVICDPGTYTATAPIFLDPPGNLRTSRTKPTEFNFSMALIGAAGDSNTPNGCQINFTFNDQVAFWMGTGRGMTLEGVYINGPVFSGRARLTLPATGVGVGVPGGGASRTLIRNVSVNGFFTGVETGANGIQVLADSNTVDRANITAATGIRFAETNNLINSVRDSVINAVVAVEAAPWLNVNIEGGNFSISDLAANAFPLSSVSVQTAQQGFGQASYAIQISGTVGNLDGLIQSGGYNSFAIVTEHYGVVPMELQSINPNGTAKFLVLDHYSSFYFGGWLNDPGTKTNLVAELQSAATIYAAVRATTFKGMNIRAKATHIENGSVPTTLLDAWYGTNFEGGGHNSLDDIYINGDLTNSEIWPLGSSAAKKAQYYIARSFPQLKIGYTETSISNLTMDKTDERLIVDFFNTDVKLTWRGAGPKLNLRMTNSGYPFTNGGASNSGSFDTVALGAGEYQDNPFYGSTLMSDADMWRSPWGRGKVTMHGIRPDPASRPIITPAQLATLSGPLPPIRLGSPSTIGYPLLWGGQIYTISDWYLGAQPSYQIVSSHHFYSFGQPLPVSWSHIGQSAFLYVSDCRLLFPGLGVVIDNGDGTGPQTYLVTGVYPEIGYVTILKAVESAHGPWLMLGDKAAVFQGASLGQEPYSITTLH